MINMSTFTLMTTEQRENKNAWQRAYRLKNGDIHTRNYEKTYKGFLMRLYRNMESRITGIQKEKFHLYEGKELISREDFYAWADSNRNYFILYEAYYNSGFNRKLAPSVDRIDSSKGYVIDNMEWVTHSENSRRGTFSKCRKYGYEIKSAE